MRASALTPYLRYGSRAQLAVVEALARVNGRTLSQRSRADIGRARELLSSAGDELDDLLDELPPPAPERRLVSEYTTRPLEVDRWKERRERQ